MKILEIIAIVLVPFLFVVNIVPFISKIAVKIGAVDKPNNRKVHANAMPSLGGLAIFLGAILGYVLFNDKLLHFGIDLESGQLQHFREIALNYKQMNAIFLASFIIILVGIIDDIAEIRPRVKLGGQVVAALILVLYGDIVFDGFTIGTFEINFSILSIIVSILWIIGITNAINLIDGLDGLAAGISSIYFLTIAIVALFANYYDPVLDNFVTLNDTFTASFSLIMLGSTLGFLYHNFHPAKIFMGDTGALFLGLIISVIPLLGFKKITILALFVPLLILAVPTLDVAFAILRRFIKREPLSSADKHHIHHQLINMKIGHRNTVLVIYLISTLFSIVAIVFSMNSHKLGMFLFCILSIIVIIFIEKTSILTEDFKPITHIINGVKSLGRKKIKRD